MLDREQCLNSRHLPQIMGAIGPTTRPVMHLLFVLALVLIAGHCDAQDTPAPQPKPKAATPNSTPRTSRSQSTANSLVVRADVDCKVSVDGGTPMTILAGKAHKFPSGPGQHLVQAESLDGAAQNEQSVDQKEPQMVVEVNLSLVLAKQAEEQLKVKEAAEARLKTAASLDGFAGSWIHHIEEDQSNAEGIYTDEHSFRRHNGNNAGRHLEVTWEMVLTHQGDAIAGYLHRRTSLSLIKAPHKILYDSFTWNGAQVTSAVYTIDYTVSGSPQADGTVLLEASYEHCSGDCGEIENNPRSEDFRGGTAKTSGSGELDWTQKEFNPRTKVFKRQ